MFFQFFMVSPAQVAEVEVTKAISVGKGFAAVLVLSCIKAQICQLGPHLLELLRPVRAASFCALGRIHLGLVEKVDDDG